MVLPTKNPPSPSADLFPLVAALSFVALVLLTAGTGRAWLPFLAFGVAVCLVAPLILRLTNRADLSFYLLLPTILSATQNVYLLFIVQDVSAGQLQLLIIVNFLYALIFLFMLRALRNVAEEKREHPQLARLSGQVGWVLVALTGYAAFSTVIFGSDPTSAVAALRNLATPILFALIGLHAARVTQIGRYAGYLTALAIAVVIFGFIEWHSPRFWQDHGIAELWDKKNIPISAGTGLPANFYSSEMIGGAQTRRMVGSFADPVNLGTFLFAALAAAWYIKRNFLALFIAVGCALAVSKGALLGFLVLVATITRYRASRVVFWSSVVFVIVVGYLVYGYTLTSSTGSSTAHIGGLLASFRELPLHPLGHGLGNVGVLASVVGGGESGSDISESGIGVILGQLGLPGLIIYGSFFEILGKAALRVGPLRERVLAVGLLGAFFLNAAFNEVALSPNSAAPYFVMIGLLVGRASMQTESTDDQIPEASHSARGGT